MARFTWGEAEQKAADLVAHANLNYGEIAEAVGVDRKTLWAWRSNPKFAARVAELVAEIRADISRIGIADKMKRVQCLNRHWNLIQKVIADRAESPEMQQVPGGRTGLMVRNVKGIGRGEDFQMVELFEFDSGLLREMRDHMKQAAQELGQWTDKVEIQEPNENDTADPDVAAAALKAATEAADRPTPEGR